MIEADDSLFNLLEVAFSKEELHEKVADTFLPLFLQLNAKYSKTVHNFIKLFIALDDRLPVKYVVSIIKELLKRTRLSDAPTNIFNMIITCIRKLIVVDEESKSLKQYFDFLILCINERDSKSLLPKDFIADLLTYSSKDNDIIKRIYKLLTYSLRLMDEESINEDLEADFLKLHTLIPSLLQAANKNDTSLSKYSLRLLVFLMKFESVRMLAIKETDSITSLAIFLFDNDHNSNSITDQLSMSSSSHAIHLIIDYFIKMIALFSLDASNRFIMLEFPAWFLFIKHSETLHSKLFLQVLSVLASLCKMEKFIALFISASSSFLNDLYFSMKTLDFSDVIEFKNANDCFISIINSISLSIYKEKLLESAHDVEFLIENAFIKFKKSNEEAEAIADPTFHTLNIFSRLFSNAVFHSRIIERRLFIYVVLPCLSIRSSDKWDRLPLIQAKVLNSIKITDCPFQDNFLKLQYLSIIQSETIRNEDIISLFESCIPGKHFSLFSACAIEFLFKINFPSAYLTVKFDSFFKKFSTSHSPIMKPLQHADNVTLIFYDGHISISKSFLVSLSPYFETLLTGSFQESSLIDIPIEAFSQVPFQRMLDLGTGKPLLLKNYNEWLELWVLADVYLIQWLADKCLLNIFEGLKVGQLLPSRIFNLWSEGWPSTAAYDLTLLYTFANWSMCYNAIVSDVTELDFFATEFIRIKSAGLQINEE